MRKQLLVLLCMTITITSFSQTRFGMRGGLNLANQAVKVSFEGMSASESGDMIPSFHIGGFADVPLSSKFSLRPELVLSGKGSNFAAGDDIGSDVKLRPYYFEIPVNLLYNHPLNTGGKLFVGAGPVLGIGAFGNIKAEGESEDYFQDGGFKRLDFSLNYVGGVEFQSGLFVSIHFVHGLANTLDVEDDPDASITWKNRTLGFSVGYFFSR